MAQIDLLDQDRAILLDTTDAIADAMDVLHSLPIRPPSLYLDMQGANMSQHGSVSVMQIFSLPHKHTFLIDVAALGEKAFSTAGKCGINLRMILESEIDPKVFFDVRNDSNVLWHKFQIRLHGVQDLQLMELATRPRNYDKQFVWGLLKCMEKSRAILGDEKVQRIDMKKIGRHLFVPDRGGTFDYFNERPLLPIVIAYCTNEVEILPRLWKHYHDHMDPVLENQVLLESREREEPSRSAVFTETGPHMACAPESLRTIRCLRPRPMC